jgi:lysophospholipase L1-like esterase
VRIRWLPVALVAAVVALQAQIVAASPDRLPPPDRPWLLAVGDSITYGWSVDPHDDVVTRNWALQVRDHLSAATGTLWSLYSVACPGETTVSYRVGACSGRQFVPALEGRSQRDAIANAIRARREGLRLIVVDLGTNDYFAARRQGGDVLASLARAAARLDAVVADLQRMAPGVPVVIAGVYDPHGTALSWWQAVQFDARIAAVARARGASVADFLHAVDRPGAPLAARCQLLDCAHHDIHPTRAGQVALAAAVMQAMPPAATLWPGSSGSAPHAA